MWVGTSRHLKMQGLTEQLPGSWGTGHLPLHTRQQESGTETGNAQVNLGQVLRPQYTFPSCQGETD